VRLSGYAAAAFSEGTLCGRCAILNPSPEYVLREFYAAWARKDFDAMFGYCADDVAYAVYLPRGLLPFVGEAQGAITMRAVLEGILETFAVVSFSPYGIAMLGQTGRGQVDFSYRHRASGLILDSVMRHEVMIERGQITCMREYHDAGRMRAFMRLATARGEWAIGNRQ
jgi:ketosteroid isomerase-like protein